MTPKRRTRLGRVPMRSRRVDQVCERECLVRWLLEGYLLGLEPGEGDRFLARRLVRHRCTPEETAGALIRRWHGVGYRPRYPVEAAIEILEELVA